MYQVINIRTITSFAQILYVFHVSADIYKYQLFLLHSIQDRLCLNRFILLSPVFLGYIQKQYKIEDVYQENQFESIRIVLAKQKFYRPDFLNKHLVMLSLLLMLLSFKSHFGIQLRDDALFEEREIHEREYLLMSVLWNPSVLTGFSSPFES